MIYQNSWGKMILSVAVVSASSYAMALDKPDGRVVLTVQGKISQSNIDSTAQFDREMLMALGEMTSVTSTPWTEGVNTFTGPQLSALLDAVGAEGDTLTITALNDYSAKMPVADAYDRGVLMAMTMNGERMSVRDKGPIFMLYPFDQDPSLNNEVIHNRSVWQVKSITVE
ncbi:molybdopterin-dependent oxidoreductase [Rhodanobacter aciditrophus]|uniref:Molybdopterin-dependent oxidoreductase n=1 Tax=Rhodanobacter aciditrophus TaxID=1623218 RepID=A0ABW4B0R4_9GAMM